MSSVETRNVSRDSLFLFAVLAFEGRSGEHRVKVRNLSAGGMMAEAGDLTLEAGERLSVQLRNVGVVRGVIAWAQDKRFGVSFETEIDPKLARAPVGTVAAPAGSPGDTASVSFTPEERRLRNL